MQRKTRRIVVAVAVIGALAAGGAAFTAANTFSTGDVAGYASQSVTGAVVSDQQNNLSGDGTQITSVTLTFAADQSGNDVKAGFDDTGAGLQTCTTTDPAHLVYQCPTVNTSGAGIGGLESTAAAAHFAVAVTNK